MKFTSSFTCALSALAAATMLGACSGNGGPQSSPIAPSTGTSNATHSISQPLGHRVTDTYVSVKPPRVHRDRRKSWISPDVGRAPRLLFISDIGTDDVYIFTMPAMTLKGTITGFNEPQGMCSDTSGNIWITNTNAEQILKYSRTGTLLATLTDSYGYPAGCAVDPATGNLAVTDIFGVSGAGQILVFPGGSGTPAVLTNPDGYYYYFAGYGPGSSLWVSGRTFSSNNYILSSCNASSCSTIPISGGTIYFPGAVQWDNAAGTWVAFDQVCGNTDAACSYPVSGSGVLGSATTYLDYDGGPVCDMAQAVIAANGYKYVAGGDYNFRTTTTASASYRWAYPAGGSPTNYNDSVVFSNPIGAAISTK